MLPKKPSLVLMPASVGIVSEMRTLHLLAEPAAQLARVRGCQDRTAQTNASSWGVFKADATSYGPFALSFHGLPTGSYKSCLSLASSYRISSHNPLHLLHCSLAGLYAVHLCSGCSSVCKALCFCVHRVHSLTSRPLLKCHLIRKVVHPCPAHSCASYLFTLLCFISQFTTWTSPIFICCVLYCVSPHQNKSPTEQRLGWVLC